MNTVFKKISYVFLVFVLMFSSLFCNVAARIVAERNSENKIYLLRYETPSDVAELKSVLERLRDVLSCGVRHNVEVCYEEIWTFLAMQYIPVISKNHDYEISKFLTNFIFRDYRLCRQNFYVVSFRDLYNSISYILDAIDDVDSFDVFEMEVAVVSEEV